MREKKICMTTLFEKLGGQSAVDLAVNGFYERVLQDDRIKHFFNNVDMDKQKLHQQEFLTFAFGGAPSYEGNTMREAHKHLVANMGLNSGHFDAVIENLVATLRDLGISEELIAEVSAIAAAPKNKADVLNYS